MHAEPLLARNSFLNNGSPMHKASSHSHSSGKFHFKQKDSSVIKETWQGVQTYAIRRHLNDICVYERTIAENKLMAIKGQIQMKFSSKSFMAYKKTCLGREFG